MASIILLEDEEIIREGMTRLFGSRGYIVNAVGSVAGFYRIFDPQVHTIAVIDLMVPDGDGIEVIATLRQRGLKVGIVVLTGKSGLSDKMIGLEIGADYYLSKTSHVDEIVGTVRALERRLKQGVPNASWILDCKQLKLSPPGFPPIDLSAQDFIVLKSVMTVTGAVVDKRTIIEALGADFLSYDERRLDTQMNRLRRKIRDACNLELPIKTLRTRGYQFCSPVVHS